MKTFLSYALMAAFLASATMVAFVPAAEAGQKCVWKKKKVRYYDDASYSYKYKIVRYKYCYEYNGY